ncbi:MAG: type III pantothenate kinase [Chitinivibrionales bacterium]|nr:type III pantothenate kinase [Chitinivibrionales bacterium]
MLVLDIGNTNTRIAAVNLLAHTAVVLQTMATALFAADPIAPLYDILPRYDQPGNHSPAALSITISTVTAIDRNLLRQQIIQVFTNAQVEFVAYHDRLPLSVCYQIPALLGADRLANCLYCVQKHPNTHCIVVDCGTAIKIDLVGKEAAFRGGFILPGIRAQLQSLVSSTALLPLCDIERGLLPLTTLPGRSTDECIRSGVLLGCAAAITTLVQKSAEIFCGDCQVLTCGGAWPFFAPLVGFSFDYRPELTLVGIGMYTP